MANTLKFGNGNWATKAGSTLAYNDESGFNPLPFDFTRASSATVVNKNGLIETVASGIPRIDFLGNTKGALLLEPQRTNNLLQSNQFDTTWNVPTGMTLTGNQLSPLSGGLDAWKLESDGSSGFLAINQGASVSGTNTFSIYAKAGTNRYISLRGLAGLDVRAQFDLQNGEVYGLSNAVSSSIEHIKDGWYRCAVTFNASNSLFYIYPNIQGVATAGNIYIQYAQLEAGLVSTSIINTSGSAVTRQADACNNGANSEVINSTEGVLYAEMAALVNDGTNRYITVSDGTNINRIILRFSTANKIRIDSVVANANQFAVETNVNANQFYKAAFSYKQNEFKFYLNGVLIGSSTSGNVPSSNTYNVVAFRNPAGGEIFYGKTRDVRVYTTALTDSELAALTTI